MGRRSEKTLESDRLRQRRARAECRLFVRDYKRRIGCILCGEKHPACLQFHHRDPSSKTSAINRMVMNKATVEQILSEIEKCDLLCANCHAKEHWIEDNYC